MSTATKSKARKQRTFTITFTIEGEDYRVTPLPCDSAIGSKAFRFAKQAGDGAVYDLYADTCGLHCQCLGFLRHGHCKHVQTVQAAGKLFSLLAPTAKAAEEPAQQPAPAKGKPAARSTGDLARNEPEAYARMQEDWSDYPPAPEPTEEEINAMAAYHVGPVAPLGGKFSKREADFA